MIDIDKHTDYIKKYSKTAADACIIDPSLYQRYAVKRGLRDISGKGVLAGLTEIAEIRAYIISEDEMVPCQGKLLLCFLIRFLLRV